MDDTWVDLKGKQQFGVQRQLRSNIKDNNYIITKKETIETVP